MSLSDQWSPTSVQVTVLQARGLRIKGKNGTNDAYAVMQMGKEKYQTSVAEKSVAPIWKEEASFDMPSAHQGGTERGALHVHVLHRALVGPDKLLGQAVINNLLQLSEDKGRDKTQWFKLLDKSGKPDKDRGEVLVDIQFTRNNLTASMFDISAAGKSRSRLGKLKIKVKGKKKEDILSESPSNTAPALSRVMTDSEGEGDSGGEGVAAEREKKKKSKVKSLFSSKTNLQKSFSQSMSVLPGKNSSLSGSMSSGLNVEAPEGKKKFKFLSHKRTASSDKKEQKLAAEQSNLCINGSHVYCEEPAPRTSRASSNFSLASSGVGSMDDVPDSSPPSVGSRGSVRRRSPWTEEEEEETIEENARQVDEETLRRRELVKLGEEECRREEEQRREEAERRQREEEEHRMDEEKSRQEKIRIEQERLQKEEEEKRAAEMMRVEEERKKREEEERVEERKRVEQEELRRKELEDKERVRREEEEEERIRLEEEEKRQQEEMRLEAERKAVEKRRQEEREELLKLEEERARKETLVEEERKRQEELRIEKEREEEQRIEEARKREEDERKRLEEEEKMRLERERERQREEEEEREEQRRLEEETKWQELQQEQERIREEIKVKKEEKMRLEKERAEEEMKRQQEEEEEQRVREALSRAMEEEERRKREEALEKERLEKERLEKERLEKERLEKERLERLEKERLERLEKERLERLEKERLERLEKERLERLEKERLEKERRQEEEERRRQEKEEEIAAEEAQRRSKPNCTDATSTNPFDESDEDNLHEENALENTGRVTSARQRCKLPVNSSGDVSTTKEKRQAPKPPRITSSRRQQEALHEAQVDQQGKDKQIKTASVLPRRAVQSSSLIKNNQPEHLSRTDRRPAPPIPGPTEEEHKDPLFTSKQTPAVSSLNPFEDGEDVDELDDTPAAAPVMQPPSVQHPAGKETVPSIQIKSSKTAHAPAPPAITTNAPSIDTCHAVTISDISEKKDCAPVQQTSPKEPCPVQEEAAIDAPPVPSRRLQPVRPLNPQDQPVSSIQDEKDKKFTGEINSRGKENVKDAGPYALLTQEELISLVLKQESQLVEKSKKISELEQYIDQLLVRVIEEAPNVLMSMMPLK